MGIQVSQRGFPQELDAECGWALSCWKIMGLKGTTYGTTICSHNLSAVYVSRTISSYVLPFLWIPPQTITDPPQYLSSCCTLVTSRRSLFARPTYALPSENLTQNRDSSVHNTLLYSLIVQIRCAVTQCTSVVGRWNNILVGTPAT